MTDDDEIRYQLDFRRRESSSAGRPRDDKAGAAVRGDADLDPFSTLNREPTGLTTSLADQELQEGRQPKHTAFENLYFTISIVETYNK